MSQSDSLQNFVTFEQSGTFVVLIKISIQKI